MKNKLSIVLLFLFITACTPTIPLQSNLSDQIMLMSDMKNIQANFTLTSDIPNGVLTKVHVRKDGTQSSSQYAEYASETAFSNIWTSYFSNKFNRFASESMTITVNLDDLYLKELSATSLGERLLTRNSKSTVEAVARIFVEIEYNGERYQNEFDVSASDYRETQSTEDGTFANTNTTQQVSLLLESALNRSVIQFDSFVSSILISN